MWDTLSKAMMEKADVDSPTRNGTTSLDQPDSLTNDVSAKSALLCAGRARKVMIVAMPSAVKRAKETRLVVEKCLAHKQPYVQVARAMAALAQTT